MAHIVPSTLRCQLNIIRAKNLEFIPVGGHLFVRYYLVDCTGKIIKLNSRKIASTSDPLWNEHISLECHGSLDTAGSLGRESVVFELRWRSSAPVLGRIVGSKLLGRTEVAWKEVLESMDMSIEKWVTLTPGRGAAVGLKPPALRLGMKVQVSDKMEIANRRQVRSKECDCRFCAYGRDEEIFAIAAAIEVK